MFISLPAEEDLAEQATAKGPEMDAAANTTPGEWPISAIKTATAKKMRPATTAITVLVDLEEETATLALLDEVAALVWSL